MEPSCFYVSDFSTYRSDFLANWGLCSFVCCFSPVHIDVHIELVLVALKVKHWHTQRTRQPSLRESAETVSGRLSRGRIQLVS